MTEIDVIGAGLAGCEAAIRLSNYGHKVNFLDCKPRHMTPAHTDDNFAELVCSNSLKSTDIQTASGMLKEELRVLDCSLLPIAEMCKVPAGSALAVDRKKFSSFVTDKIKKDKNINIVSSTAEDWDTQKFTIIATGPLTVSPLDKVLQEKLGEPLSFFDAIAPIVSADSIDFDKCFFGARYNRGDKDYLNCPMSKEEYTCFYNALISAERIELKDFEINVFEACMPIEIMARRGYDTLRFGPLRPVGLSESGEKNYAVLQLRKEDILGNAYNLVGFQTNLKYAEQKRVFGLIPALKNAEFLRFGQMHRNTFINAPRILERTFACKKYPKTFIAGQLSGVEGYVESIASGLMAAENMHRMLMDMDPLILPDTTIIGAMTKYLTSNKDNFQPVNANFGILSPLEQNIKDKFKRKQEYFERGLKDLRQNLSI